MSTHKLLAKQTVVYPWNGVPLNDKMEWTNDTCNLDESQIKEAKRKQPLNKIIRGFIFIRNIFNNYFCKRIFVSKVYFSHRIATGLHRYTVSGYVSKTYN